MFKRLLLLGSLFLSLGKIFAVAESGDSVVVIYNSLVPKSKEIAEHYAQKRHVPAEQLLGLELPNSETISRDQFTHDLQKPLLKWLESNHLLSFRLGSDGTNEPPHWRVEEAKIRYAVLCYGVPLRILSDSEIHESVNDLPAEARNNGAAVDSELTLLPMEDFKLRLSGPLRNPFLAATNAASINPVNGILLVARLDGPTPEIANQLVDKAIQAETDGLWGRAYIDIRGVPDAKAGDDMFRNAAETIRRFGFETIVDERPETFSKNFPMSQIAFYAGWYDGHVSGPFSAAKPEFMPGAVAYHLHSFSAATLRSASTHWAGPFLAKGVTATMGCVDEPYVTWTPDMGVFFDRFLRGFSFGEAAWAAAPVISWQTTVVGDPLYRPFAKHPREQHADLMARKSNLIEWSHLRVANLNLVQGYPISEVVTYLETESTNSPVLLEKLADLYATQKKNELAVQTYKKALASNPTPEQKIRLQFILTEKFHDTAADPSEKKSGDTK